MQTPMVLGPKTVEKELWALTDKLPVKAITDFWNTKVSKSWKHVKLECFLDALDLVIFQGVVVDFSPFSLSSVHGIVTALNYDPNTFKVVVEIELAVEDGMTVEDSSYWTFGTTTYTVPTDTDLDYHPQLSVFCPGGHNKGNPKPLYHMCLTKVPPRILRTQPFDLDIEIHDATDTLQPLSATFNGKVYTTSPHDSLVVKGFSTVGGKATLTVILKGSLLLGRLHLYVMPVSNKEIASGDVIMYKPKTLNGKHM